MLIQSFRRWIGDKGPSGSLDAILNIKQPTVRFFCRIFSLQFALSSAISMFYSAI